MTSYADRRTAGAALGAALVERGCVADLVLGLPRGGVPVAAEVARALDLPLDVFVVRKLGAPGQPELAVGALASGGVRVLNDAVLRELAVSDEALERVAQQEQRELERRERAYRGGRGVLDVQGSRVVLVDDGLATGATVRAGVAALRLLQPASVTVAVPVGAQDACDLLAQEADDVLCLRAPEPFLAVGMHYRHFDQTTDDEVRRLLLAP